VQHCDECVVALALELAHAAAGGLSVGLLLELGEQLLGQLRNVGELCPRPLQRRAELLHEVPHSRLAACDPVEQERAHARPAKARTEADRVVDLLDGRDTVVHGQSASATAPRANGRR
jgi:hypothetical protein